MTSTTLTDFTERLASKAPTPGGGGAAALAGALASALASMVCNLTLGKRRYAVWEEDIKRTLERAGELQRELLEDIDRDAAAFGPLSAAYSIPKDSPDRGRVMEDALKAACRPPMDIAGRCCQVLELLRELADKGSAIAVSDVGVGAQLARAALLAAGLNVKINAKSMADREYAGALTASLADMEAKYLPMADGIYARVLERIGG